MTLVTAALSGWHDTLNALSGLSEETLAEVRALREQAHFESASPFRGLHLRTRSIRLELRRAWGEVARRAAARVLSLREAADLTNALYAGRAIDRRVTAKASLLEHTLRAQQASHLVRLLTREGAIRSPGLASALDRLGGPVAIALGEAHEQWHKRFVAFAVVTSRRLPGWAEVQDALCASRAFWTRLVTRARQQRPSLGHDGMAEWLTARETGPLLVSRRTPLLSAVDRLIANPETEPEGIAPLQAALTLAERGHWAEARRRVHRGYYVELQQAALAVL